jgi:hypothetical protein
MIFIKIQDKIIYYQKMLAMSTKDRFAGQGRFRRSGDYACHERRTHTSRISSRWARVNEQPSPVMKFPGLLGWLEVLDFHVFSLVLAPPPAWPLIS